MPLSWHHDGVTHAHPQLRRLNREGNPMRANTERPQPGTRRSERGQALIMFVLAAGVLFGFVAMTIDVGIILHERRQLQNTADAAALAGAIELPNSPGLAYDKAQHWAELNGIDVSSGDQLDITVDPI